MSGLAPLCTGFLIPIYRGTAQGGLQSASQIDLARAIRTAVDRGAHIINISGGELSPTPEADQYLIDALTYCEEQGVLVVAAAGNDGCDRLHVPASVASVLAAGAIDPETGLPMGFSNWGHAYRHNAILAPGKDIRGAQAGGGFVARSGTSFATPIVTGIAALLTSVLYRDGGRIDPLAARAALLASAIPCDPEVLGDYRPYLAGRLDVRAAFERITQSAPALIEPTPSNFQRNAILPTETGTAPSMAPDHASAQPPPGIQTAENDADVLGGRAEKDLQFSEQNINTKEIKMSGNEEITCAEPRDSNVLAPPPAPTARAAPVGIAPSDIAPTMAAGSPVDPAPGVAPSEGVDPSDCGCGCGGDAAQLVFALGKLRYDLVTEARKDSLWQAMHKNPYEWANMIAHLEDNPWDASDITWTLEIDATPIYAIQPAGPYAAEAYKRLIEMLKGQVDNKIERISVPGVITGSTMLTNGIVVPVVVPTMRGMYAWNTDQSVKAATKADTKAKVENFLNRVYYELRSLGQSPQERAINFAATNAFQAEQVFDAAAKIGHELDTIKVERSPICRQDSDCWDVIMTTFDPLNDRAARMMHRFTIDVSDIVPCTVGAVRSWSVR